MTEHQRFFSVLIDKNHPACDGHFEGNPIVPGVVTLEYVRIAFTKFFPKKSITTLQKIKFTHLLRPGQTLEIQFKEGAPGLMAFDCFNEHNHAIAHGLLSIKEKTLCQ